VSGQPPGVDIAAPLAAGGGRGYSGGDGGGGAGGGGGSGGPSLDSRAESGISLDGSIQLSSAQPITGSDSGGGGDALAVGAALVRSVEASAARFEQLGAQVEP
jgi:hypothetical protein